MRSRHDRADHPQPRRYADRPRRRTARADVQNLQHLRALDCPEAARESPTQSRDTSSSTTPAIHQPRRPNANEGVAALLGSLGEVLPVNRRDCSDPLSTLLPVRLIKLFLCSSWQIGNHLEGRNGTWRRLHTDRAKRFHAFCSSFHVMQRSAATAEYEEGKLLELRFSLPVVLDLNGGLAWRRGPCQRAVMRPAAPAAQPLLAEDQDAIALDGLD